MAAEPVDWIPKRRGRRSIQPSSCRSRKPLCRPEMMLPSPTETKTASGTDHCRWGRGTPWRAPTGGPRPSSQLFADLIRGRLLAFGRERVVPGVPAIPAERLRRFERQVEGLIVRPIDEDDAGAEDQELRDLGRRRLRGARITAGRPAAAAIPARAAPALPVEAVMMTSAPISCARATTTALGSVLERGGRVAAVVLQPQPIQSQDPPPVVGSGRAASSRRLSAACRRGRGPPRGEAAGTARWSPRRTPGSKPG